MNMYKKAQCTQVLPIHHEHGYITKHFHYILMPYMMIMDYFLVSYTCLIMLDNLMSRMHALVDFDE